MATNAPLFTAVSSSTRQVLLLLRCISFSQKANVRISPEGLRFSTEEGSVMEAFVFLDKSLFTSFTYNSPPTPSTREEDPDLPVFEINLTALLETLNIFSLSDHTASHRSRDEYEHFTAHRINRHTGINAFSNQALGVSGICTLSYDGEGSSLNVHMSEAGVTTTCELTTYEADTTEEIPFSRDSVALKTIMRSTYLLDAITELSSVNPTNLSFQASPNTSIGANLSLSASGALGSATVDFTTNTDSDTPILETFHCAAKTNASFKFSLFKAAQRAMASASKVSLRLDDDGVLSMQYLIEMASSGSDGVTFVDFRVVPLVDGEDGGAFDDGDSERDDL
ncbi:related to DNA repair exonuclease rad1 [Ramularia collo-cygni]|uniref:Related to DNA repair exonuclease rad1 n=1 Tax=Ramularia collo-cygni TaxID=112498 RepID=A0A2D3V1D0_9PEZI|nr:related to DNA repair exonuclease rad1 [Ramularia collo-cygni]CZT15309.1 related to DNA repair exonuclease rad1 [Ramularia collo-cygni]